MDLQLKNVFSLHRQKNLLKAQLYIQLKMQKNLTTVIADVPALPDTTLRGVFPVLPGAVFFCPQTPFRVRR